MTSVNDPNLGLYFGWEFGETPWNSGMDQNMVILGGLATRTVISKTVAAEPAGVDGAIYFVPAGATGTDWNSNPESIAVYSAQNTRDIANNPVLIGWTFTPVKDGWSFTVQDEDNNLVTWDEGGGDFVEAVDVGDYLTDASSYTASGSVVFSNSVTFTGSHTANMDELATMQDLDDAITGQDFSAYMTLAGSQTVSGDKTFSGTGVVFSETVAGVGGGGSDDLAINSDIATAINDDISLSDAGTGQGITVTNTAGDLSFKTITSDDASVTIIENEAGANIDLSVDVTGSVSDFLDLSDTPVGYGDVGQYVIMNGTGDGLIFADGPLEEFTALTDTPSSYAGADGYYLTVNEGSGEIEFTLAPFSTVEALTDLSDAPNSIPADVTYFLGANAGGTAVEFAKPTFIGLDDTPASYEFNKIIRTTNDALIFDDMLFVNMADGPLAYDDGKVLKSTASGVEWGGYEFIDLDDTPAGHQDGLWLRSTSSLIEFIYPLCGDVAKNYLGEAQSVNFTATIGDVHQVTHATGPVAVVVTAPATPLAGDEVGIAIVDSALVMPDLTDFTTGLSLLAGQTLIFRYFTGGFGGWKVVSTEGAKQSDFIEVSGSSNEVWSDDQFALNSGTQRWTPSADSTEFVANYWDGSSNPWDGKSAIIYVPEGFTSCTLDNNAGPNLTVNGRDGGSNITLPDGVFITVTWDDSHLFVTYDIPKPSPVTFIDFVAASQNFTAEVGHGYLVGDTQGDLQIVVTAPSSPIAGDEVSIEIDEVTTFLPDLDSFVSGLTFATGDFLVFRYVDGKDDWVVFSRF